MADDRLPRPADPDERGETTPEYIDTGRKPWRSVALSTDGDKAAGGLAVMGSSGKRRKP
jgi:hypothetical protein